ncbi:beta-glucosidase btgE [Penicillium hispanicum]|uniref:beta-glucosidase btgE n=1 Tax=Penicillium hispanicum TaxID=1080232 RepID=UPI0025400739|nr:beta-glucosidase btgE [Penicillium hispanicum]KAJ5591909.1 beta-glucosidase btgE [Penicillium hispanicum]
MKGTIFAAAAMAGSALADGHLHRRHDALHQRRSASASYSPSSSAVVTPSSSIAPLGAAETCGCTTKVITVWGSPTLVPIQPSSTATPEEETSTLTSTVHSTKTNTQTVTVTPSVSVEATSTPSVSPVASPSTSTIYVSLPTAGLTTFSATGTYTIPATTLTVTDSTTVVGATSTEVASGTHTIGGVTTVVETSTTVTCPYATVKPSGSTVTSVIETTTYVCPSAGTYTVVPGTTTVVPSSTAIIYPTPQTITPGTYTQPESVVTVTKTDYTYVCPFATGGASTTAVPTTSVVPTTAVAPTTTSVAPVVVSTSSSSSQPASTGSSGSAGSGVTGKGQYGMTFSPYTEGGDCMTQDEVTKNIGTIKQKGFDLVRVYSTDCNSLEYIGSAAKQHGMKMIIGVYIDKTGISGAESQVSAITSWAEWSLVELIVVGNEAVSSGFCQASDLATFISSSKTRFQSAGYTGQVTTTEPIDIWQKYGTSNLCSSVDIVGANIHPFFNAQTTAEEAGTFALSEYKLLEKICNKDVLNLETGWPNAGETNGAAVPGVAEQKTAIEGIVKYLGSKSIFFSYADDSWKNGGEFDVEKHWGCASVF